MNQLSKFVQQQIHKEICSLRQLKDFDFTHTVLLHYLVKFNNQRCY